MARYKKQRQGKNDANTGKVPQEVAKDKSSLKSVGHEDHQHRWHHSVRNLPPGQIIDIPFLKDLTIRAIVGMGFIPIGGGGSAAVVDRRLCPKSTGERN